MFDAESLVGKEIYQFKLEKFLARGAAGLVFRGRDKILNRTVALKLIPKDDDLPIVAEARRRFIQEVRAVGRLSHPNIVTIYSHGETDDYQYICMEFLEGKTLGEILQEQKKLSVGNAIKLFKQVLAAIDASYRAGIVHRDIKPMNLMVTNEGIVKVMDFGVAKLPSLALTTAGTILGTPYYMSPEQITGRKVDIRSDIFSTGAVLYQSLTGERPFEADTSTALAYMIVNVEPVPPNIATSNLPDSICTIIRKAMAKDPSERYQTPGEMLDDLVDAEEHLPVELETPVHFENTVMVNESEFLLREEGESDDFAAERDSLEKTVSHSQQQTETNDVPHPDKSMTPPFSPETLKSIIRRPSWKTMAVAFSLLIFVVGVTYSLSNGLLKWVGGGPAKSPQSGASLPQGPYEGKYQLNGVRPDGTRYQGTAVLSRSGDRFSMIWNIDNQTFSGNGALSGNQLAIHWTQASKPGGFIVYKVNPNGILESAWANGKGTETLAPIR
jgi:serine/threonine protein kinase